MLEIEDEEMRDALHSIFIILFSRGFHLISDVINYSFGNFVEFPFSVN